MNDPTSANYPHGAYFDAVHQADEDLAEALSHIRVEEEAGRITVSEAAGERAGLLDRHLQLCARLRRELLGELS